MATPSHLAEDLHELAAQLEHADRLITTQAQELEAAERRIAGLLSCVQDLLDLHSTRRASCADTARALAERHAVSVR